MDAFNLGVEPKDSGRLKLLWEAILLDESFLSEMTEYGRRKGLSESDAEDVCQIACQKAWSKLPEVPDQRAGETVFRAIFKNTALDLVKYSARHPTEQLPGEIERVERRTAYESDLMKDFKLKLRQSLPDARQLAVFDRTLAGEEVRDIATALSLTISQVHYSLGRIAKLGRKLLGEQT